MAGRERARATELVRTEDPRTGVRGTGHPGAAAEDHPGQRLGGAGVCLEVGPGGGDVQVAAVGAAEGDRGWVARGYLDHAVEGSIGAVAVDGPGSSQRDPQHALIVDSHAVRPDLRLAEVDETPAAGQGACCGGQVEDVDNEGGCVREVEASPRLVQRGPVADRQAPGHAGHLAAVDPVQGGVARPLVIGHRPNPGPAPAIGLDVVRPVLSSVLLDRDAKVHRAGVAVEHGQAPGAGHDRLSRRAQDHPAGLPAGGPGTVVARRRVETVHPLPDDVHPPQPGCGSVPRRALGVLGPDAQRGLNRDVTHGPGLRSLVAGQTCPSAPGRWASSSSACATIGMPPWPTASGVRW